MPTLMLLLIYIIVNIFTLQKKKNIEMHIGIDDTIYIKTQKLVFFLNYKRVQSFTLNGGPNFRRRRATATK